MSLEKLSSHKKRLLTAGVVLPALAFVIWKKGVWITLSLLLLVGLGLFEFYNFFWQEKKYLILKLLGIVLGFVCILVPYSWGKNYFPLPELALLWICALSFLFSFGLLKDRFSFLDFSILFFSFFYLPVNLKIFQKLNSIEIILVFGAAFVSDTAAYYLGTLWGKQKIWSSVSPKKTWLGSGGGLLACILTTVFFGSVWGHKSLGWYVLLGTSLGIAAQLGDFFESALKRKYGVKDSGKLLPGHGGILDRIDSLLFVLPVYYAFSFFRLF
ncbi:MAG: phosphatidate cytidylyltransferase [Desulfonauticus sp.]|nr:phosphatidate cytidylyltransferase [Desulfonauticus sp.]